MTSFRRVIVKLRLKRNGGKIRSRYPDEDLVCSCKSFPSLLQSFRSDVFVVGNPGDIHCEELSSFSLSSWHRYENESNLQGSSMDEANEVLCLLKHPLNLYYLLWAQFLSLLKANWTRNNEELSILQAMDMSSEKEYTTRLCTSISQSYSEF